MSKAEMSLEEYLKSNTLDYSEYTGQFLGILEALNAIHEYAIHRDIKPENILVQGDTWLLSDFGLCDLLEDSADLTGETEKVGPRYWMSPESVNKVFGNNDTIDKSSDVFQICSVFWFIINGRHPYGIVEREDWKGTDELFDVIKAGLSHNPSKRPQNGEELLREFNKALFSGVD